MATTDSLSTHHSGSEWLRGRFAWEYKGKKFNLRAAYLQLQQYRDNLENPPLLIACDLDRFEIQSESQQGDFAQVPVKMSVRGSYHEIAVFFDRLAKMPRIVNVTDLQMTQPTMENKKIVVGSSIPLPSGFNGAQGCTAKTRNP